MKNIVIILISIVYIKILYPQIILLLTIDIHNFILIFISIIISIDNIILKKELTNKINDNIMEEKYLKIIFTHISNIYKKIDNLELNNKRILRSNSLNDINN